MDTPTEDPCSTGFWGVWSISTPAPPALVELTETAIDFWQLNILWEVRVFDPSDNDKLARVDALTDPQFGNCFYLTVNQDCGREVKERGTYVAFTVLHEVCHCVAQRADRLSEAAFDKDDTSGSIMEEAIHQLVDDIAWRTLPSVYPNLDPEEDFFNVEKVDHSKPAYTRIDLAEHLGLGGC